MKEEKRVNSIVKFFDYKMWLYDFVKWTGALPALLDLRIKRIYVKDGKISKRPKGLFKGSFLITSNHLSYSDPIILSNAFWERRVGFIATSEIFDIKFFGKFLKKCGSISIDRKNISMQTFKDVKERFIRGHIVALFPEGKITLSQEQFSQFKSGAIIIALYSKVPIVPVYIEKRTNRLKRQKIFIGEKFDLQDYCNNEIPNMEMVEKLSQILRKKEIELEEIAQGKQVEKEKKYERII